MAVGEMKSMKAMWIVPAILAVIIPVVYMAASYFLARAVIFPDGLRLAKEIEWEKENGLWDDFETYSKEVYTVQGFENYTLHTELVKAEPKSNKYVILTHGFRSNRYGSAKYVKAYRSLGYNCIIYDTRGHGENVKTAVTLGNTEAKDLLCLIEDSYARYGEDIYLGLHGESMGSSTSLSVLALTQNVRFVVADCGFTNLYALLEQGYRAKDTFITPDHSETLFEANQGKDFVNIIPDAEHAQSRQVLGSDAYAELIALVAK